MLFCSSIMKLNYATVTVVFVALLSLSYCVNSNVNAAQELEISAEEVIPVPSSFTSGESDFETTALSQHAKYSRKLRNTYLAPYFRRRRNGPYLKKLFQASCIAKCYDPVEQVQLPGIDEESQFLTNPVQCIHPACFQCLKCIETNGRSVCDDLGNRIEEHCWNGDVLEEKVKNEMDGRTDVTYHDPVDSNFTHGPVFHCSESVRNLSTFNVYYRWEFEDHANMLQQLTIEHPDWIPRLFLVEIKLNGNWMVSEMTSSWLISITVPPDTKFQARITAISPKFIYLPQTTEPLTLANEGRGLESPESIKIVRIRQNPDVLDRPDLEVLIHWDGGGTEATTTCGFVLHVLGEEYFAVRRDHANQTYWFPMSSKTTDRELKFNQTYSLEITASSDVKIESSNSTNFKFRLPTCLDFFNHSFSYCPPSNPTNIQVVYDKNLATLGISWDVPEFADSQNPIELYEVKLSKLVPYYHGSNPSGLSSIHHTGTRILNLTVDGNLTSVELTNFTYEGSIRLAIRAYSLGRYSAYKEFDYYPDTDATSTYEQWIGFGLGIAAVLIGAVLLGRLYKHKRGRNRKGSGQFPDSGMIPYPWIQWLPGPNDLDRVLDENNLSLGRIVGSGFFGVVYKATLYKDGTAKTVAVKFLKECADSLEAEKLQEEFKILAGLEKHPHVMELIGAIKMEKYPYPGLVVEYCQGGDLRGYLQDIWRTLHGMDMNSRKSSIELNQSQNSLHSYLELENAPGNVVEEVQGSNPGTRVADVTNVTYFNTDQLEEDNKQAQFEKNELRMFLSYALQIASAMEHLSKHQIIHRDLAARNVLVSIEKDGVVLKIADFGLSRDVYERSWYKKESTDNIPLKWLAMECLFRQMYTTKSDVWSYGVLLWEIVTYGGSPYPGIVNMEVLDYLKKGHRMEQPPNCPDPLYDLMHQCWNVDPNSRPDFSNIRLTLENMLDSISRNTDIVYKKQINKTPDDTPTPTKNLVINPQYTDAPIHGLRPLGGNEGYEIPIRRLESDPTLDLITKNFSSSCSYLRPRRQGVDLDLDSEQFPDSSLKNLNSVFVEPDELNSSSEEMMPIQPKIKTRFLNSLGDGSSSEDRSYSESSIENVHNSLEFDMELEGNFNPSRVPTLNKTKLIVMGNRTIPCRKGDFGGERFKSRQAALY